MKNEETTGGFYGVKTLWDTIIHIQEGDEATRRAALDRLTTRYRKPILCFVRLLLPEERRGQAEDLTHEFIQHRLLADVFFRKVNPQLGRFRTFVKKCVANFLEDKRREWNAKKRGAGQVPVSLDETDGEGNHLVEPPGSSLPPESAIDRAWAIQVLEHALSALERECADARRGQLFRALKGHLGRAPEAGTSAEIGAPLGMDGDAVRQALSRLRQRLGELIKEEVRQTVGTQEDWREELKYLVELLGLPTDSA
jgi:RNA polymerase sigma-70 factor (ECF subfamily)